MLKNLPAMQETWFQPLGREYPLEEEMATHSSILAWRIPWTEEPGGLQSMGLVEKESDMTSRLNTNNRQQKMVRAIYTNRNSGLKFLKLSE